jgi:tripartite-type tricarboxylate transporter receptor subunit TctC
MNPTAYSIGDEIMITTQLGCRSYVDARRNGLRLTAAALLIPALLALSLGSGQTSAAAANAYPQKAVRLAIPMAPGGPVDLTARMVAQRLTNRLGQPVIVENRAGAGGALAPTFVAGSPPDGHVLLFMSKSSLLSKLVMDKTGIYDMLKELAPITQTDSQETMLVVNLKVPAQSLKELISLAKSRPGKMSYASNGVGSGNHLNIELFKSKAGVDIVHVPYKGQAPAMADFHSGRIDVTSLGILLAVRAVKDGQLKGLAITGTKRHKLLPDVPTFLEQDITGLESGSWKGFLAPAGTAPDVIGRLHTEIVQIMNSSEVSDLLTKDGQDIVGSTPQVFTEFIRKEQENWRKVVKDLGLSEGS